MRRVVVGALILFFAGWAQSAHAEVLEVKDYEFAPLVETRKGRLESCGVSFDVLLDGPFTGEYYAQGSVNLIYHERQQPTYLWKIGLATLRNEAQPEPVIIKGVYISSNGASPSDVFHEQGENGHSWIFGWNALSDDVNNETFFLSSFGSGVRFAIDIGADARDLSFSLPGLQSNISASDEYLRCSQEILLNYSNDLPAER